MGLLNENIAQTISDFNDIKSKIIENGVEVPEGTKTSEYANKIDEVSEKATSEGYNNGYTTGKEDGIQSEYDRFWDAFYTIPKSKGSMELQFAGKGWTNETFKPKYDIKPTGSSWGMFRASNITGDLDEI